MRSTTQDEINCDTTSADSFVRFRAAGVRRPLKRTPPLLLTTSTLQAFHQRSLADRDSQRRMFNPKTPLQAGLIFLGGIVFIAWTTNDVYRTSKQNSQALTPEQLRALQDFGNEARRQAAGKQRLLLMLRSGIFSCRRAVNCTQGECVCG